MVTDRNVKPIRFRTGLRRQNLFAYMLVAGQVGAFGWITIGFRPTNLIMRTGGCLVVLGFLYCGYQVYTRGGHRSAPADAGFADCLNFYRSELGRLRDFHNAVWSRLLAIIPGYMVFCLGFAMAIRKGALLIGAFGLIALALGSGQETVQARHSGNYRDHRLVIRTSELLLSALVEKM